VQQLTMADLFQRHGVQPTGRQARNNQPVVTQQLSLFGIGQGQLASAA
jgi:hypothetical protein